ncbi:surface antigen [Acetobacter orientalis]|uniref:Surface antigen n=3 Tax=Acetobacter orientalis TaxID=146474 RepID=A0A252A5I6_9PROT|nr:hypothetical protein HK12_13890 [Acetobacter orientalis]BBC79263.1 surface antigen [Acetobacter orientalis]
MRWHGHSVVHHNHVVSTEWSLFFMRHVLFSTILGVTLAGGAVVAQAQTPPTSLPPGDAPTQAPGNAQAKGLPPLDKPLKITGITLSGNQRLSTAQLMAAVPFKVGEHVSQARITAGLQDVMKVYAQHNLTGTVKQALDINGESVHVRWNITEAEPAPTTDQPLVVESINFDGNLHVATHALRGASKLQPGQNVTPAAMLADEKAMQALYVKKSIGVTIVPSVTHPHNDNRVKITYHLTERSPD